jgi:hypothetical protein
MIRQRAHSHRQFGSPNSRATTDRGAAARIRIAAAGATSASRNPSLRVQLWAAVRTRGPMTAPEASREGRSSAVGTTSSAQSARHHHARGHRWAPCPLQLPRARGKPRTRDDKTWTIHRRYDDLRPPRIYWSASPRRPHGNPPSRGRRADTTPIPPARDLLPSSSARMLTNTILTARKTR